MKDSLLSKVLFGFERSYLLKVFKRKGYSRTAVAEYLGIPMSTLKFKMNQYGIYDVIPSGLVGRKRKRGTNEGCN